MMPVRHEVIRALLTAGVVGLSFDQPRVFKSGIQSPVYLDNRKLLFHPQAWRTVVEALVQDARELMTENTVIAGIETAGIPHSSVLAYALELPSVFVRKQAKDHGLRQRVEGGDVAGRPVILIEDQITTGGSSLSGVEALRDAGGQVAHCLAITSYGLSMSTESFADAGVAVHVLAEFADIFTQMRRDNHVTPDQATMIAAWLENPTGWVLNR
jgi:orotate phosphoribosyltransferase